jgi:hypothetical protein
MAILGSLLKKGIMLRESIEQQYTSPFDLQKQELRKLLIQAKDTQFGIHYDFSGLLKSFKSTDPKDFFHLYTKRVPIHDYHKMHNDWWSKSLAGQASVSWPGRIKYFALSSGTSGAPSKHIPVSKETIKSMRKTSVRQILCISKYDLPDSMYTKGILMLGGSTDLRKNGDYFEGDLSGITTSQIPFWFQRYYKPGKKISKSKWDTKLDEITSKAKEWDIGIIVGVPAWLMLLMEKIVAYYNVKSIHDVWPNLSIFVHGGVPFQPYKKGFERLLSRPLIYMETYLASEGFIAFQSRPKQHAMNLVLNNGIFYEFVPFNEKNFDEEGELKEGAISLNISEVMLNKPYALLLSTNAGAWRYLIGDVVKFTSVEDAEIIIAGRTKLFLSLCGEHLSLDNMNKAIELTEEKMNIVIKEFTVTGEVIHPYFGHAWYIGCDETLDIKRFQYELDKHICALNDDYAVERQHALKEVKVVKLPSKLFYEFMARQGKVGAQIKFPRVLKGEKAHAWKEFLKGQVNR